MIEVARLLAESGARGSSDPPAASIRGLSLCLISFLTPCSPHLSLSDSLPVISLPLPRLLISGHPTAAARVHAAGRDAPSERDGLLRPPGPGQRQPMFWKRHFFMNFGVRFCSNLSVHRPLPKIHWNIDPKPLH